MGIPSPSDTLLEMGALAIAIAYVFQNGDYLLFSRAGKESLLIAIPLVAIVTLTLLFAGDNKIALTELAFSRKALQVITVGHAVLVGALAVGTFQGIRAYAKRGFIGQKETVKA